MTHDIFTTPNKVDLTITEVPTPSSYSHYQEGRMLGETMPMWRVQTEGYTTHAGQLVGIVSRDAGFLDSPDAEWISGGVNSKGPNAVALGRHGNFFHWGFAASPTYLTDEAKDVFVNALHYIAGFDGQTPIARKVSGIMIRSNLDRTIESLSDEGYADIVAMYARINEESAERIAAIQERIDAGEEVSERDLQIVAMPPNEAPDRMGSARRIIAAEVIEELEEDPAKVTAYLNKIKPYVYPEGWYSITVDEDLMELGIANNDIAVLDKGIELLDSNESLGRELLERYTIESFETTGEWKKWLKAYRSRLFFSESAGYKWLVNTIGDPRKIKDKSGSTFTDKAVENKEKIHEKATLRSPLAADLSVEGNVRGGFTLTLHVDIFEGWHAYDLVPANLPYVPLTLSLELPEGVSQEGEWTKPSSHPSPESPGLRIFEGPLVFKCDLKVMALEAQKEIACKLSYQVCDVSMCMPPTTTRVMATIEP